MKCDECGHENDDRAHELGCYAGLDDPLAWMKHRIGTHHAWFSTLFDIRSLPETHA